MKKPIPQMRQTIFPSQYTIHYDTSHLSLRNVWLSLGISSSERKHTPLNNASCTLKLKCHMWEIFRHVLQVSCSETCTNNKQGKKKQLQNFWMKTNSLENRQTIFATNTISIKTNSLYSWCRILKWTNLGTCVEEFIYSFNNAFNT